MWRHPEIRTLPDVVRHWGRSTPDQVALAAGDTTTTYRELDEASNRLAHALIAAGATGGRVCFIGKNLPEFWVTWMAAGKAGAAFVPLNWRCAVPELTDVLSDAAPAVVIAHREYEETIARALPRGAEQVEVVVFDSTADGAPGLASWCGHHEPTDPGVHVTGEDIALVAYTSGTTGRPKGVMIRHEAFDLFHLSDELEPTITWSPDDVHLMVMPNFHLAGSWVSLPALYHGATVAMLPAFEPRAVVDAVRRHGATSLCLVPTAIQALLDLDDVDPSDLSTLRTLVYAGSAISPGTIARADERLGCELRQFYGTTETYIITILRPADHVAPTADGGTDVRASCGEPVPLVDVRVVDPAEQELPAGEVGHVLVRSPMVMAGYLGAPEETARVLREGWYRTGDLGYRGESGHLFLVDRAKDMVVSGGENVYSVEVERAIQGHPDVALVAVVGTPHERWGEAVTAYVVPAPGADRDRLPDALAEHCRALIAAYKVPKIFHLVPDLPLTPTGKVRKADLRARTHDDARS